MVLRGARQVGKTWLVRQLAKELDLRLIEINFERAGRTMTGQRPREEAGKSERLLHGSR